MIERSIQPMETEKLLCYVAMGIAGLVLLVFLLDAAMGVLGRASIVLDVMFILGAGCVLWQGIETAKEFR